VAFESSPSERQPEQERPTFNRHHVPQLFVQQLKFPFQVLFLQPANHKRSNMTTRLMSQTPLFLGFIIFLVFFFSTNRKETLSSKSTEQLSSRAEAADGVFSVVVEMVPRLLDDN